MAEENTLPADAAPAAPPPAATPEGEEGAPKKGKKKLIFIILGAVVAIGGGVGYYMWSQQQAEAKRKQAELEATPEYQLKKQMEFRKENKPPRFIKMDEFTVNLPGRGGEHYLQTTVVLRTGDAGTEGKIKQFLPVIRDKIILVLSSRTMQELATVDGKNAMAKEIALVINSIIEPQLTAIYILQQRLESAELANLERIGAVPKQTTAGERLSQTAIEAAAQYWKVTEMDLPVQGVLFDRLVMQ
jgi:flagellar FliL protein